MIKAIIFDFDGVIESNYELHFELSRKGITDLTREEHRKLFEGNIHTEREKLKHRDTGFDVKEHFSNEKTKATVDLSIKNALVVMSKKYLIGILSSGMEYGINRYLKNNGVDKIFSFVYGHESGVLKSEKFKKIFNKFNLSKNECVFVTDTLGDILEANKVGVKTVAIDSGYHERERLQKGDPSKIISSLSELPPLIESNF